MKRAISVDVGGTNMRAAVVSETGEILGAEKRRMDQTAPADVLSGVEDLVGRLGGGLDELPMAVGLAGFIRLADGVVVVGPNLGWRDVPFGGMLTEAFRRPVRLVNDLAAITVGEAQCGSGRGSENVICVFVGTGVGMGAVVHGRVLEGYNGFATEFGHVKVASPESGRRCGCGERGCLEAYASGGHFPQILAEKIADGASRNLLTRVNGEIDQVTASVIEAAAGEGDAVAREMWQEVGRFLGMAIGNLVTVFNPSVLVLGGGVLESAPSLKKEVVRQIEQHAGRAQLGQVAIRDSELRDDAGVVGAGLLAHQTVKTTR